MQSPKSQHATKLVIYPTRQGQGEYSQTAAKIKYQTEIVGNMQHSQLSSIIYILFRSMTGVGYVTSQADRSRLTLHTDTTGLLKSKPIQQYI